MGNAVEFSAGYVMAPARVWEGRWCRWDLRAVKCRPITATALMRLLKVLPCFVLAACSAVMDDLPQMTESAPYVSTVISDLKKAAETEKMADPLEVAGPIAANPISSAPWIICLRSVASEEARRLVYSVFFKNGKYDSVRLSVIVDRCEAQTFTPLSDIKIGRPPAVSGAGRT
jgi:hypothetical protein